MRRLLLLLFSLLLAALTGCSNPKTPVQKTEVETVAAQETEQAETQQSAIPAEKEDITILYTNDIHGYIFNEIKNDDDTVKPGLRLSSVAAMKKDLAAEGKNVLLVDAGDEIQGTIYTSIDKGEQVINIMNAADYDLACPGNHEFDFGMAVFFDRIGQAKYPFISSSMFSVKDDETVLDPVKIFDFNGTKVAFVGITTPEVPLSTAITTFRDENKNKLYEFAGTTDPKALYAAAQDAIDSVRNDVDYVIALGHVGMDTEAQMNGFSSRDVIENTEGLDAFIDGHSHTTIEGDVYKDKSSADVILTQTGTQLSAIGKMTINSEGKITTELVTSYDNQDETVAEMEEAFVSKVDESTNAKIGVLENKLYSLNPDNNSHRMVRAVETNLGDFVTDGFYWYINEVVGIDCDVTINNGGGIRSEVEAGDITYRNLKNAVPYGNQICLISVTGAQLKDIFESGAKYVGWIDPQTGLPGENSSFFQVAGARFIIDGAVPSSAVYDSEDQFVSVDGEYKVKDVQVYNKATGMYEDIVDDKTYNLGGVDYILRNGGSSMAFLSGCSCIVDYLGADVELMVEYVRAFAGKDGYPLINTRNSPLASWPGYLLDYENTYGSGRINIIN